MTDPAAARPDIDVVTAGARTRREVLGDDHVDRAAGVDGRLHRRLPALHHPYAWGEIWTRPGLDRETRSCITLAMLAAMRYEDELAMHVRAALRNGLTRDEIKEVLLQVGVYAGVPAANQAFADRPAGVGRDRRRERGS